MNVYSADSLEKALEKASYDLNRSKEELSYRIIRKSKGFFKQFIEIEIIEKQETASTKEKEPLAETLPRVRKEFAVQKELVALEDNSVLKLEVTKDKLEAYITVEFCQEPLKASKKSPTEKQSTRKMLTQGEVLQLLEENNIIYGVINKNIQIMINSNFSGRILVAKGEEAIDDIEDRVYIHFSQSPEPLAIADEKETVKYKELCILSSVQAGELLGSLEKGSTGRDGVDVYGQIIKCKKAKKRIFKAGKGAKLQGDNRIVAVIDGKPSARNGVFEVNEIYEHRGDVDIKSGSIDFRGNIRILGSVREGMKIEGSGEVEILGTVERALVVSSGDMYVKGSVLHSHLSAGGKDNEKLQLIKLYNELQEAIDALIEVLLEIKKYHIVGQNKTEGQIIKALFESKFKSIPKVSMDILESYKRNSEKDELVEKYIVTKILGLMPVNIKNHSEIQEFSEVLKAKALGLKSNTSMPVNVFLSYCQDSEMYSSGDIVFNGKGEYQSKVSAAGIITFQGSSVARGGSLESSKEIRCETVGSIGGVITRLSVPKQGHIFVEKAYQNTLFSIGDKEKLLEVPKKKVHAYLGEDGLITIDGFNM